MPARNWIWGFQSLRTHFQYCLIHAVSWIYCSLYCGVGRIIWVVMFVTSSFRVSLSFTKVTKTHTLHNKFYVVSSVFLVIRLIYIVYLLFVKIGNFLELRSEDPIKHLCTFIRLPGVFLQKLSSVSSNLKGDGILSFEKNLFLVFWVQKDLKMVSKWSFSKFLKNRCVEFFWVFTSKCRSVWAYNWRNKTWEKSCFEVFRPKVACSGLKIRFFRYYQKSMQRTFLIFCMKLQWHKDFKVAFNYFFGRNLVLKLFWFLA